MDLRIRLVALGIGAFLVFEVWRAFGDRADAEPGWIAALMGETLEQQATPIRFWAFVICESGLGAAFIVCAFLPPAQMRALMNSLVL